MTERRPITDLAAYLDTLPASERRALRAVGELLVGVTDQGPPEEDATKFTLRCLGVEQMIATATEQQVLVPVARLTAALALAELINEQAGAVDVGPGEYTAPPAWTTTAVGEKVFHHPAGLRAAFPAGTLIADAPCVVAIRTEDNGMSPPQLTVFVPRADQDGARAVLDRLLIRAAELNPYRGRAIRATYDRGLQLTVIDLPTTLTRHSVVVDEQVWQEIDLGLTAVRDRHELLNAHGLGARRGVLLVGPPGTGKSAVAAAIAAEVVGVFTVIYVEARAGEHLLTAVVEEAQRLGGPILLILEDVDLWVRERARHGGAGLAELLQAMDIASEARILTLASTNDAGTLDRAAIRTGRFDSIVEVGYPDRAAAARILDTLLAGISGADGVDSDAVAAALPEQTSGSDLREIVRRAVLAVPAGEPLSSAALLAEVGSGRYRAQLGAAGAYL